MKSDPNIIIGKKYVKLYWDNGANCAQSTARGILEYYNLNKKAKVLFNAFTAFGGGFDEGDVCGAVSGVIAAIGVYLHDHGYAVDYIISICEKFKANFTQEFEKFRCDELMKPFNTKLSKIQQTNRAKKKHIEQEKSNFCTSIVFFASSLAIQIMNATDSSIDNI